MLVQEETRLKNHGNHPIHYVNNQGDGKKTYKKCEKGKGPLKVTNPLQKSRRKMTNAIYVGSMDIFGRIAQNNRLK